MYPGNCAAKTAVWNRIMAPYVNSGGLIVALASWDCGDYTRAVALGIDPRRLVMVDRDPGAVKKAACLPVGAAIEGDIVEVVSRVTDPSAIDVVLADFCGTLSTIEESVAALYSQLGQRTALVVTALGARDGIAAHRPARRNRVATRAARTARINRIVGAPASESYRYTSASNSPMLVWVWR